MVGFQHPQSSLPRREGIKLAGNPKHGWVSASSIPSPAGRRDKIGWKSKTRLGFGILNPLSPWERARERVANRQVCFLAIPGFAEALPGKLLTCSRTAKGRPTRRLRTLKTSKTSFDKTSRGNFSKKLLIRPIPHLPFPLPNLSTEIGERGDCVDMYPLPQRPLRGSFRPFSLPCKKQLVFAQTLYPCTQFGGFPAQHRLLFRQSVNTVNLIETLV